MKRVKTMTMWLVALALTATGMKAQTWQSVALSRQITHPQPMTGLVLWPDEAEDRHANYGESIQLEFSYCLPCKVVKGCSDDGAIDYDWSSFDELLDEVAGRGHQLVASPGRYEGGHGRIPGDALFRLYVVGDGVVLQHRRDGPGVRVDSEGPVCHIHVQFVN